MPFFTFIHHYILWHYTHGLKALYGVSGNMLWYTTHAFGLRQHLRSFFSPWKRITEQRREGWSLENIGEVIVVNTVSRFIGTVLRLVLIALSLFLLLLQCAVLVGVTVLWIGAPLIIIGLLLLGSLLII